MTAEAQRASNRKTVVREGGEAVGLASIDGLFARGGCVNYFDRRLTQPPL